MHSQKNEKAANRQPLRVHSANPTRIFKSSISSIRRIGSCHGRRNLGKHLGGNPIISRGQSALKLDRWLPTENVTQARIIAVAAPHSLRSAEIVTLGNPSASNSSDQVD